MRGDKILCRVSGKVFGEIEVLLQGFEFIWYIRQMSWNDVVDFQISQLNQITAIKTFARVCDPNGSPKNWRYAGGAHAR